MDDVNSMATSCPLCLGSDEVGSMVTVEIDRIIPKGRAAIMICRRCTGAVIRAARHADPELLDLVITEQEQAAIKQALSESSDDKEEPQPCPACGLKLGHEEDCPTGKGTHDD